jgi:hypothetical protein
MRSRTVTEYDGELLGPIDWAFDFSQGVASMCSGPERKAERMSRYVELLWEVERRHLRGEKLRVCTSGFWHELLDVGMYDGWPFWKPTPALCVLGPLGPAWDFYYELDDVKVMK